MNAPLSIGLLGAGVVGGGVLRLLAERAAPFQIARIAVRDPSKRREGIPNHVPIGTVDDVLADDALDVVVELMGGLDPAHRAVRTALENKKHVVTANKVLVAEHGSELVSLAERMGVAFRFEASVAGCLPIVEILQAGLVFDRVERLFGILNGTCNYILTSGQRDGLGYPAALRRAQDLGFAEADPSLDVSGADTAQKLAILTSILTGRLATVDPRAITGIPTLGVEDHHAAEELGYRIKLLGIYRAGPPAALRVAPTLVGAASAVGLTTDEYNVVEVECRHIGWQLHLGKGAGRMPTAAAVLHDLSCLASPSSALGKTVGNLEVEKPSAWTSRWMVRIPPAVNELPMSKVGEVLNRYDVEVVELRRSKRPGVGTLFVTRTAKHGDVITAARGLNPASVVLGIEPEA